MFLRHPNIKAIEEDDLKKKSINNFASYIVIYTFGSF